MRRSGWMWVAAFECSRLSGLEAGAQAIDSVGGLRVPDVPIAIGGVGESRVRAAHLTGAASSGGFLLRSTSSLGRVAPPVLGSRITLIPPAVRTTWNSDLAYTQNEGGLWAGRGLNLHLLGGARASWRGVTLSLLPEASYQENRDFQILEARRPNRSRFGSPWQFSSSIDLPQRFGEEAFVRYGPGETSLEVRRRRFALGAATERQWWGPGVRNAIVLGGSAPGFPHLFARTGDPIQTAVGFVEAKWILGALSESPFFDGFTGNDHRSLSGVVVTVAPAAEPNLTLGLARTVYATVPGVGGIPRHALDAVLVGNARRRGEAEGSPRGSDQLSSLFFRWVFPTSGFEAYGEWARSELPRSVRDFLVRPDYSQGYTVGAQWLGAIGSERRLRLNPEITYLEQGGAYTQAAIPVFYRSETVPQGYTHRGQLLGAGIGPGSSQWIAADLLSGEWEVGVYGGRIRWDNDAYYTSFVPRLHQIGFVSHDVTTLTGIRGFRQTRWGAIELEATTSTRYDYLFQNRSLGFNTTDAVDVPNHTLRLRLTPRAYRLAR